eukprot:TRINITY_DN75771_c0_g1_i1.p1 TRINITY_DN75771_c0_g1~~TRINITY_DN75771_c0_g1_i1.p1  ORF type:complete len:448 (-),score=62.41 TRINITY_DN75771_c0_g1_i1:459-1802(-)
MSNASSSSFADSQKVSYKLLKDSDYIPDSSAGVKHTSVRDVRDATVLATEMESASQPAIGRTSSATMRSVSLADRMPDGDVDVPLSKDLLSLTGQVMLLSTDGHVVYGTEHDVGEDAWAAALVAIVEHTTEIGMKMQKKMAVSLDIARMSASLLVILLNLLIQLSLLLFIQRYLVAPSVREVQLFYDDFLQEVFDDDHMFQQDAWENYDRKDDICSIVMLNPSFYYSLLLIWLLTGLEEVRNVQRTLTNISYLPSCALNSDMLEHVETQDFALGGRCHIKALTAPVRACLIIFVCIPRGVIAFYLILLGCDWLSAAHNFADMITNSLALSFVIHIDELLYSSVLPVATRKNIAETKIYFQDGSHPKTLRQLERREWMGLARSIGYITFAVLFMVVFGEVYQTVLPRDIGFVSMLCHEHHEVSRTAICTVNAAFDHASCFPKAGHMGR